MTPELERAARALRARCALPEEMPVGLAEELAAAVLRSVLSDPSEAMVGRVGAALAKADGAPCGEWGDEYLETARAALRAAAAHVLCWGGVNGPAEQL